MPSRKFKMGDHPMDRRNRFKLRFTAGQNYRLSPLDGDNFVEATTHWVNAGGFKGPYHCGAKTPTGCPLCPIPPPYVQPPADKIGVWVFLYVIDGQDDEFTPMTHPSLRGSVRFWDFGVSSNSKGQGKYDDLKLLGAAARGMGGFGKIDIGIKCTDTHFQKTTAVGLGPAVWQEPAHRARIEEHFNSVRMTDEDIDDYFGRPTPSMSPVVPQSLTPPSTGPYPQIVDGEALEDQKQLPAPDDEIPF